MIGSALERYLSLPEGSAERFDAFHALLIAANEHMDLTAVTDDTQAFYRHYLDALTALPWLPEGAKVIDIGTGAGFPGVPLALSRPDLSLTLLDAQKKRVRFLQNAIQTVPFEAISVHGRAEDFAKEARETFDVAVSRAVASLPVLLEWALPLVRVGGHCILWKGPGVEAEISDAGRISPLLGGGAVRMEPVSIPEQPWTRFLVLVDKKKPTPRMFPRKAGMAKKRPL